jgi:hypothetical protein
MEASDCRCTCGREGGGEGERERKRERERRREGDREKGRHRYTDTQTHRHTDTHREKGADLAQAADEAAGAMRALAAVDQQRVVLGVEHNLHGLRRGARRVGGERAAGRRRAAHLDELVLRDGDERLLVARHANVEEADAALLDKAHELRRVGLRAEVHDGADAQPREELKVVSVGEA